VVQPLAPEWIGAPLQRSAGAPEAQEAGRGQAINR
jgi:hypothetical protein